MAKFVIPQLYCALDYGAHCVAGLALIIQTLIHKVKLSIYFLNEAEGDLYYN